MFRKLMFAAALSLAACSNDPPPPPHVVAPHAYTTPVAANVEATGEQRVYNDGVYFFDVEGDDFAVSLAAFKHSHPELVVTAIGSLVFNDGYRTKYFVSTEPRQTCKCEAK